MSPRGTAGFTLVELLIVVIILGILAGVVIPMYSNSASEAKESTLSASLRAVRECIELYKLHHNEAWPGDTVVDQLTGQTDVTGATGTDYGPYFRGPFPLNSINMRSDVTTMPTGPVGDAGWLYAKSNGAFRANVAGAAPSGKNWFDL